MLQLRDQQQPSDVNMSHRGTGSLRQRQQNLASKKQNLNNSFPVQQSSSLQNRSFNSSSGGFKPTSFIKKRAPLNQTTTHQQSSLPRSGAQTQNFINNSREFGRQNPTQKADLPRNPALLYASAQTQQVPPQQSTMLLYKPGQAQQQLQSLKGSFNDERGMKLARESSGEVEYRSEPNLRGQDQRPQNSYQTATKFDQEISPQNAPFNQSNEQQVQSNRPNYHSLNQGQIAGKQSSSLAGFQMGQADYASNPNNAKYFSPKNDFAGVQPLRSGPMKKSPTQTYRGNILPQTNTFNQNRPQQIPEQTLPFLGDVRYQRGINNQTPLVHQGLTRPPLAQYQSVPVARQNAAKNSQYQSLGARFYPSQNEQANEVSYIGGPAVEESPESVFDQDEDDAFREMEQLLAELDQDVTDLKRRNFFSKQRSSQGPPVQRIQYRTGSQENRENLAQSGSNMLEQNVSAKTEVKSSSLSPSKSRSNHNRSDNSSDQLLRSQKHDQGIQIAKQAPIKQLSNTEKRAQESIQNSQSEQRDQGTQSQPKLAVPEDQKSDQFTSPVNNVESAASEQNGEQPQLNDQGEPSQQPRNNQTSENNLTDHDGSSKQKKQNQHQERLFRLSPLSSKMQEGSDGEDNESEQNRQVFPLNSSINSQNESQSTSQNNSPVRPINTREEYKNNEVHSSQRLFEEQEAPCVENRFQPASDSVLERQLLSPNAPSRQIVESTNEPLQQNVLGDSQIYVGDDDHRTGGEGQANASGSPGFTHGESGVSNTRISSPIRSHHQSRTTQMRLIEAEVQTEEQFGGQDLANLTQVLVQDEEKVLQEQETQTKRQDFENLKLSPFDTYDLYFVKDLVNDLHKDNEVLNDSNQDLKHAFRYLLERHKKLQVDFEKEQTKTQFLAATRERLTTIAEERDTYKGEVHALNEKLNALKKVIVVSVQEQQHVEQEAWGLVDQLQEENQQLRNILAIGEEASKPATTAEIETQISSMEQRMAEARYKAEMKERESAEEERRREIELAKEELSIKIEKEYAEKFDQRYQELEEQYKIQMEKAQKAEKESSLLKKTLLEQARQRANQLKNSSQEPPSDRESSSLEGSAGPLKSKSLNANKPQTKLQQNEQEIIQKMLQSSGLSSDLSSSEDNRNMTSSMQQELAEFAENFDTWTAEEQDLIQALNQREAQISGTKRADDKLDEKMDLEELQGMNDQDDADNLNDRISDEEGDFEEDFHERFGDLGDSPTLEEKNQAAGTKIQVISKPANSTTDAKQDISDEEEDNEDQQLDDQFATKSFTNEKKAGNSNEKERNWEYGGALSNEFFGNQSSPSGSKPNELDFDEDNSDALKEVQRQEQLRQRYEEYFASEETDLIEKELMMAADESASDHSDKDEAEKLSPRSFEKAHSELAQTKKEASEENSQEIQTQDQQSETLQSKSNEWARQRIPISRKKQSKGQKKAQQNTPSEQTQSEKPSTESTSDLETAQKSTSNTQSVPNKYKRVKKDKKSENGANQRSAGSSSESQSPSPSPVMTNPDSNPDKNSKNEQTSQFQEDGDQEPQKVTDQVVSEELATKQNDDLQNLFESMGQLDPIKNDQQSQVEVDEEESKDDFAFDPSQVVSGSNQQPIDFDFGDDFIIPKQQDSADEQTKSGSQRYADFFDDGFAEEQGDDDYQFYQELSKGFTGEEPESADTKQAFFDGDDTSALRQMMLEAKKGNLEEQENTDKDIFDNGALFFENEDHLEREEAKEEEYDYFLDAIADENANNAKGYHVIDEDDLKDDSYDEEDADWLDEEQKKERHNNMLGDFKKQLQREDEGAKFRTKKKD